MKHEAATKKLIDARQKYIDAIEEFEKATGIGVVGVPSTWMHVDDVSKFGDIDISVKSRGCADFPIEKTAVIDGVKYLSLHKITEEQTKVLLDSMK